ncbi:MULTISPECIES: TRAP transporter large permease [Halomonadaceae]|jgi:C4-dicarboxylate transporter, DctM subunit|uniref:TRAP transporter large permease protein n=1 Tax=Vreelandella titanicae TaxID=664683 RepID=A0A654ANT1_9GAMM|nr:MULTISPECIES: TRAP transporter large permease subunit [Halomonas]NAO96059.1 TRAP transporter large permease subunit [Halomonas sp. MG34]QGQ69416.1 TRAP transporter large permease subunit [Halomonas sp. PA16-9]MCD1587045.1 TRAP transporter large permease subunit [Halomonas sp. IOP_14]MCE7518678.1 TRAP transporter large permease subunit [Halomonas titanicae]NVE90115.1 TRAP transporter large permease subunit [Halomonas titanicae]|tara:strand:- start:173 stop:1477 length:1305 start_codon:yes stop_codon:yes gene_type:complete
MDIFWSAVGVGVLLLFFLSMGTWIFASMLAVSIGSLWLFGDFGADRIGLIFSRILYRASNSWELSAIPLFILMGELIFRSNISERLFKGLVPITRHLPGGILHTNVLGCTLFAAVSGSSAATTATIGKITTQELKTRGYDRNLSIGSLAGAGSLGLLIPPSIVMIVYGVQAEVSISQLFMAGVVPGLLIALLYSVYIGARTYLSPSLAPKQAATDQSVGQSILLLLPVLVLISIVIGSIYSGIATPSEAAAVGVAATLVLLGVERQLSARLFIEAFRGTLITSIMVCSLLITATLLSTAMGYLHLPRELAEWIAAQNFTPMSLLLALAVFYVVLGLFLDGISITVMSLPITLPIVLLAGFDPIWFGIFLIIMIELGQITPPVGFNLFVLQSLTGESISRVALAALPFFLLMCVAALIISLWPDIALWLPRFMAE